MVVFTCDRCGAKSTEESSQFINASAMPEPPLQRWNFNRYANTPPGDPHVDLASIDSDIEKQEAILEQLHAKRKLTLSRINALTPVMMLPPEITTEIMVLACAPSSQPRQKSDLGRSPLFLGAVCGAWRDIAWSAGHLWKAIYLPVSVERYRIQVELLREWLSRAGEYPLSIKIASPGCDEAAQQLIVPMREILHILATRSEKWHAFNSFFPNKSVRALASIKNRLPLLVSLTAYSPDLLLGQSKLDVFANAPDLRSAYIMQYYLHNIELPWDKLKKMKCLYFSIDECLEALRRTTNIVCCEYEKPTKDDNQFPISSNVISLPHLQQLTLTQIGTEDAPILFDRINAPSLSELTISYLDVLGSLAEIGSFLTRSASHLTKLSIRSIRVAELELIAFLQDIPSLQELELVAINFLNPLEYLSDVFVASFSGNCATKNDVTKHFLPNLRAFSYDGGFLFSEENLLKALAQRWAEGPLTLGPDEPDTGRKLAKLKYFVLKVANYVEVSKRVRDEILAHVEEGMDISITIEKCIWVSV